MGLFQLVSAKTCREVALQEECLPQPPAPVKEQHLSTGPTALPCAIQGCEFERPIIKGIRFDGHGSTAFLTFNYELSLHTMSTRIKTICSMQKQGEGGKVTNSEIALVMSDRDSLYRS